MSIVGAIFRVLLLAVVVGLALYLMVVIGFAALVIIGITVLFVFGREFIRTFFGGKPRPTSSFEHYVRHEQHSDGSYTEEITIEGEFRDVTGEQVSKKLDKD